MYKTLKILYIDLIILYIINHLFLILYINNKLKYFIIKTN